MCLCQCIFLSSSSYSVLDFVYLSNVLVSNSMPKRFPWYRFSFRMIASCFLFCFSLVWSQFPTSLLILHMFCKYDYYFLFSYYFISFLHTTLRRHPETAAVLLIWSVKSFARCWWLDMFTLMHVTCITCSISLSFIISLHLTEFLTKTKNFVFLANKDMSFCTIL